MAGVNSKKIPCSECQHQALSRYSKCRSCRKFYCSGCWEEQAIKFKLDICRACFKKDFEAKADKAKKHITQSYIERVGRYSKAARGYLLEQRIIEHKLHLLDQLRSRCSELSSRYQLSDQTVRTIFKRIKSTGQAGPAAASDITPDEALHKAISRRPQAVARAKTIDLEDYEELIELGRQERRANHDLKAPAALDLAAKKLKFDLSKLDKDTKMRIKRRIRDQSSGKRGRPKKLSSEDHVEVAKSYIQTQNPTLEEVRDWYYQKFREEVSERTVRKWLDEFKVVITKVKPLDEVRLKWTTARNLEDNCLKLLRACLALGIVTITADGHVRPHKVGRAVFLDETHIELTIAELTKRASMSGFKTASSVAKTVNGLGHKVTMILGYNGAGHRMPIVLIFSAESIDDDKREQLETALTIERHDGHKLKGMVYAEPSGGMTKDLWAKMLPEWMQRGLEHEPDFELTEEERQANQEAELADVRYRGFAIIDGVQSHVYCDEAQINALASDIDLHATLLTPNTTSMTQGCDTTLYGVLKGGCSGGRLQQTINDTLKVMRAIRGPGSSLDALGFANCLQEAAIKTLTHSNIASALSKTAFWTFDPAVIYKSEAFQTAEKQRMAFAALRKHDRTTWSAPDVPRPIDFRKLLLDHGDDDQLALEDVQRELVAKMRASKAHKFSLLTKGPAKEFIRRQAVHFKGTAEREAKGKAAAAKRKEQTEAQMKALADSIDIKSASRASCMLTHKSFTVQQMKALVAHSFGSNKPASSKAGLQTQLKDLMEKQLDSATSPLPKRVKYDECLMRACNYPGHTKCDFDACIFKIVEGIWSPEDDTVLSWSSDPEVVKKSWRKLYNRLK
eukprot:TRINITY_DN12577_c1_g1_i6.p1 TRINITY_DN12577_c1_g1~~TRINITY_DN12577_c1_g1_i6.p1  ORF type:complete len:850 (+),score=152.29 TRINITY_DN12577_c1_g1_i6:155-2704(+)